MRVLFVTSEFYPLVKTGGLADASAALPAALRELGLDIRVMLPGYPEAMERAVHLGSAVPLGEVSGAGPSRLLPVRSPGSDLPLWLIDCPSLFCRAGGPYQDPNGRDWPDNDMRFWLLSHAAARVSHGELGLDWRPDVVHANDWHAGLVPLLMDHRSAPRPASVFTIHNLAFQGLFGADRLPRLGIPAECFSPDGIEFHGRISFLKAGIRYADYLTTVSRTYAREILTPEFGCGLDGLLRQRARHLAGIPNGADYAVWDPANDVILPQRYSLAEIGGKHVCKATLQQELGLAAEPDTPVVAFLSRLTEQKMADRVAEAVPWLVEAGAQLALHGQGDRAIEKQLRALADAYPGRVSVHIGYEERRARRLLAGADILLHPSRFEPFGLVPIYAMRYGTLPVVRAVGGLSDTVVDSTVRNEADATGFAFSGECLEEMLACLDRALTVFRQPLAWRRMQRNAMRQDFGWQNPAEQYLALYRSLVGSRAASGSEESKHRHAAQSGKGPTRLSAPLRARPRKGVGHTSSAGVGGGAANVS